MLFKHSWFWQLSVYKSGKASCARWMSKNCFIFSIIRASFWLFVSFPNLRHLPWNLLCLAYFWEKQERKSLAIFPTVLMSSVPLSKFLKLERRTCKGEDLPWWGSTFSLLAQLCLMFSRCFPELDINILHRVLHLCRLKNRKHPGTSGCREHPMPREGVKLGQGTVERYDLVSEVVKCWLGEPDFTHLSSLCCLKVAEQMM